MILDEQQVRRLAPLEVRIPPDSTGPVDALEEEAGVRSIPTVAIYRDGEEVERFVGVTAADEIRAALE